MELEMELERAKSLLTNWANNLDASDMRTALRLAIRALEQQKHNSSGWIPVSSRPLTDEEKEYYGDEYEGIWDCVLPDESMEVIITRDLAGKRYVDYTMYDAEDKFFDVYQDEVVAWMPFPEPYRKEE